MAKSSSSVFLKNALKERIEISKQAAASKTADVTKGSLKPGPHPRTERQNSGRIAPQCVTEKSNIHHKTQGKKAGKSNAQLEPKKSKPVGAVVDTPKHIIFSRDGKSSRVKCDEAKKVVPTKNENDTSRKPQHSNPKEGEMSNEDEFSWSDISETMDSEDGDDVDVDELETPNNPLTALQSSMQKKLEGAQFRWLNQELYTMSGTDALDLLQKQPHLFDMYHRGFRAQAESWPETPAHRILREVKQHINPPCTIVDLGCGDAEIAQALTPLKYTVHSFDLVAKPPHVQAANMAKVPLADGVADVVIFSLALMNTDWGISAAEGARLLRKGGIMKIAEVVSRISDPEYFIKCLQDTLGLVVINKKGLYIQCNVPVSHTKEKNNPSP